MNNRALMNSVSQYDVSALAHEWTWLIPADHTPLFISVLADWVFGAPDGSLWCLSVLEGDYTRIAVNAAEYNRLNKSEEWLKTTFIAGWQSVAAANGLLPNDDECLGWKVHPLIGGELKSANLQVFDMLVYQGIMGQLHRQLRQRPAPPEAVKPWFKFWS